jgi:hypothetical protein
MEMDVCFEGLCVCQCGRVAPDFDRILGAETRFGYSLQQLSHSNIGWFVGDQHLLTEWQLDAREGLYLLWHKDGWCPKHELFHLRGLYVGKGRIGARLFARWRDKDFSAQDGLVYWTYVEMLNRQAKYIEQLLLDLYAFPMNKSEMRGKDPLCAHLTQSEVD